jgi:transcription elongation factor GreB
MATYITARGAAALAAELNQLATVARPKVVQEVADAAAQGDRSENAEYIYGKKRLREIDRRIRFLTKRLDDAHVVDVTERPSASNQVFFAAIVTVEDEEGQERRYQLVGPDEANPTLGLVNYQSPLGTALLKRKAGDTVTFRRPAGETELTLLSVEYGRYLDLSD